MWTSDTENLDQRRECEAPIMLVPSRRHDPELAAALEEHQLQILFQPQFDVASGQMIGAEALARMPGDADADGLFRRAAAAGLAERVSREIQRGALRIAADWGESTLGLSINVLPQDLARAAYPDWLKREIRAAGIAFDRITIEITEEALIRDFAAVAARLEVLRDLGLKVALDDFGSGFASLSYLSRLPLDALKIDRGLVAGIEKGPRQQVVVRNVVHLARELGLKVVVEGVETEGQLALLRDWGCDLYQGFLHARPMAMAEFRQFALSNA